jgi:hypothetical protein
MERAVFAALMLCGLCGCAVQKTLIPTGGSRADGVIKLSYEYGVYVIPQIDLEHGRQVARQRCAAWGYSDAEPFGGQTSSCQRMRGFACAVTLVTIQYQCIQ